MAEGGSLMATMQNTDFTDAADFHRFHFMLWLRGQLGLDGKVLEAGPPEGGGEVQHTPCYAM